MSISDIDSVVDQFARSARLAAESGFAGVEIHAGHGFLLEQFMSTKTNRRTDAYGGTPEKRAKSGGHPQGDSKHGTSQNSRGTWP